MIITCDQCQTRFRLADDKVKPGGSRVRCARCQHVFIILPPSPPDDSVPAGEQAGATAVPAAEPEAAQAFAAAGPAEFDFGFTEDTAGGAPAAAAPASPPEDAEPPATYPAWPDSDVRVEAPPALPGDTDEPAFAAESAGGDLNWLDGTEEDADRFAFAEEPDTAESGEDFLLPGAEAEQPAPFDVDAVFGRDEDGDWRETGIEADLPFDFDAPPEAGGRTEQPVTHGGEGGLSFGEISFGEPAAAAAAPEPLPASPAPPVAGPPSPSPASPSQPTPAPQLPGAPVAPAPAGERSPASQPPGQPRSRTLLLLLLLAVVSGAGSYFYFAGDDRQLVTQLREQLTGTGPARAEQRIGLSVTGSSYVDNRETGPLLVIQGVATNNFTEARSAITVKGMLLDAAGKVLQQQTVYCGNYLSEAQLQGMKYAQIEEAMNNQFGEGLVNMNVRPAASLRFTIVFRNVPQGLGNINVEVADSKPGGP